MTTFLNVDLNLLRVFQAIAEERSLTRAGERLHLSQPAVSHALTRLREVFKDPLFIRGNPGMRPTPCAVELAKPISRALQAIQDALSHGELFDPKLSTRTFKVSMSDAAVMFFVPALCAHLHSHAPGLRVHVQQVPLAAMEEALRTGQLDFVLGNLPALKPLTQHAILFLESYVCMTRKRKGLPRRRRLEVDELQMMSHVLVQSTEGSHRQLDDSYRANGMDRQVRLSIPHYSALPQILGQSDLAAIVPLRIAKLFNVDQRFAIYQLPIPVPDVEVTLHWHENYEKDLGSLWMREAIINLLQSYGRGA